MGDARKHNTLFYEHNPTDPAKEASSQKQPAIRSERLKFKSTNQISTAGQS